MKLLPAKILILLELCICVSNINAQIDTEIRFSCNDINSNIHEINYINQTSSTQSRKIAIKRAKELFIATANGDVVKLKQILTPDFYKRHYPYSDSKARDILLSVPYERRQKMIDNISNHSEVTTIVNRAGDVITVMFSNKSNNKIFTVQLFDEYGNDDWKIFEYDYIK